MKHFALLRHGGENTGGHSESSGPTTKAQLLAAVDALREKVLGLPDGPVTPPDDGGHDHEPPGGDWEVTLIPGEGVKVKTHAGLIPDLSHNPTHTLTSGDFPTNLPPDARVLIPKGVIVTVRHLIDVRIESIANLGTLRFARDVSTKLRVGTILNYPGSVYDQGTDDDPIEASSEILFDGTVPASDPEQITVGLVSFGGKTTVCGKFVDGTSTTELAAPVAAGSKVITVKASKGWKVGDELLLHDDSPLIDPAHPYFAFDRRTIASIAGNTVTLTESLKHPHDGTVDHLTRNVVFSEAPGTRAHTILMGATDAHLCCARFNLSGRTLADGGRGTLLDDTIRNPDNSVAHVGTNQRGRYPVHAHHLQLPFAFDRLVVEAGIKNSKWGLSHHTGHGSVTNCNVLGFYGAGIVGEAGTETGKHTGCSVSRYLAGGGEPDYKRFGLRDSAGRLIDDRGFQGNGMWYRGPFVPVEDCKVHGWMMEGLSWNTEVDPAAPQHPQTVMGAIEGRDPSQVGTFDLEVVDVAPVRSCKVRGVIHSGGIVFWGTGGTNVIEGCCVHKQNYFSGSAACSFHNFNHDFANPNRSIARTRLLIRDSRFQQHPEVRMPYMISQTDGMAELTMTNVVNDRFTEPLVYGLGAIEKATLNGVDLKAK